MSDDFKGRGGSPWGSPPGGDNNGSGRGPRPPDIDEIIRNIQKTINRFLPGGSAKGGKSLTLILVVLAVPSFKVLYKQDTIPPADVTIKAIGYQWYWGYEYPDEKIGFDSYMVEDKDLKDNQPRLLTVDNEVYVPVNKVIKVMITANDVLHAWALPSFGVKRDAVPGRINETWFKADRTGTYYGQCSELCGIKHAFMPITVNVVTDEEYAKWLEEAKQNFALEGVTTNIKVAKKELK